MNNLQVSQNFDAQLQLGEVFENHCRNLLGLEGYDSRPHPQPNCPWDFEFEAKGHWYKVECKNDVAAKRTGRFYFETEYRKRPSGIYNPEPDYWMHGWMGGPVLMFQRVKLLHYLIKWQNEGKARLVSNGGDDGASSGYIVPVNITFHAAQKEF